MAKMTAKDERFVAEYLACLDPKEAALKAGFSLSMANSKAYQWVSSSKAKPLVFAAIRAGFQKTAAKLEVTSENVINELRKLGFSDIRKAVRWRNSEVAETTDKGKTITVRPSVEFIDSDQIDDDTAGAISEVSVGANGQLKMKFYDKRAALVDLGKVTGVFADGVDVTIPVKFTIEKAGK